MSAHLFRVGDMVKICPDIERGNDIDPELYITKEMASYAGQVTKITGKSCVEKGEWFELEIDGGGYWWSVKMFIPLQQKTE